MGIKDMLGILPMLAKGTQTKDLVKSGMLGIGPSLIAKDMAEQDRQEREIEALKEMEMLKRQQAAAMSGADDTQTASGQGMKRGGKVSSASKRADGCATKGKTKGRFV